MEKGSFQQLYKKALYGAMLVLTWCYLQTGLYRFVMPDYWKVFRIEQWFGLLLAGAALVYLCIAVCGGDGKPAEDPKPAPGFLVL